MLDRSTWNHFTVYKQMGTGSFKKKFHMLINIIYV